MVTLAALVFAASVDTKGIATGGQCDNVPLPITPQGPIFFDETIERRGDEMQVTAWRVPCSASESLPVVTFAPAVGAPFVCSAAMDYLQDGIQNGDMSVIQGMGLASFCGDLFATITLTFDPFSASPLNPNDAMTIIYEVEPTNTVLIEFPDYNPADYDLEAPPLDHVTDVSVRIGGKEFIYRDCGVATFIKDRNGEFVTIDGECLSEEAFSLDGFED